MSQRSLSWHAAAESQGEGLTAQQLQLTLGCSLFRADADLTLREKLFI